MKLEALLEGLSFRTEHGSIDKEITAVVNDSRKVVPGCLFICIAGAKFDSHEKAAEAALQGAAAVLSQREISLPAGANFSSASASMSQLSYSAGRSSAITKVLKGSPFTSSRPVRRSIMEAIAPFSSKTISA